MFPFHTQSARRLSALATSAVLTVAALTGCGPTDRSEQAPDRTSTVTVASGSKGETTVGCDAARQQAAEAAKNDLTFGPLSYPGLARGYPTIDGKPADVGPDGLAYYKIGTYLDAGAEATVSVDAEARDYAGIRTEGGRVGGYSQVTYQSCTKLPADTVNWWVGGFLLRDRDSACMPLDVTIPGEKVEHVDLAFPVGACN